MNHPTDPIDRLAERLEAAIAEVERLRADVRMVELMMTPPDPVPPRPELRLIQGGAS